MKQVSNLQWGGETKASDYNLKPVWSLHGLGNKFPSMAPGQLLFFSWLQLLRTPKIS